MCVLQVLTLESVSVFSPFIQAVPCVLYEQNSTLSCSDCDRDAGDYASVSDTISASILTGGCSELVPYTAKEYWAVFRDSYKLFLDYL